MRQFYVFLLLLGLFALPTENSFAGPSNIYGVSKSKNFFGTRRKTQSNKTQVGKLSGVKKFSGTGLSGGLKNNYFGRSSSSSGGNNSISVPNERPTPECYGEARALCTK